ncbi:MAG TPA: 23S rRNA (guanine(2445)-N(2))/(guanine(2069)-N(7))-methyltransferase, partial [Halomonas sp.]|nr:23S rRNA (guanine(2445)-N(2))/(guanine(2069)-N(7))-methyltransferase [Halomonas sp.]
PAALTAAKSNAMRAGIPALITLHGQSLAQLSRPDTLTAEQGLMITNPPYGERLGELPELVRLYAQLGEKAKALFPGWTLALFTGNPDLGHRLGLRAHKQYALKNGALDAKLLLMEIGSSRPAPQQSGEPSEAGVAPQASSTAKPAVSENAQMFANRLAKNQKRLKKWLKQSGETCYRIYDADMPE